MKGNKKWKAQFIMKEPGGAKAKEEFENLQRQKKRF